MSGLLVKSTAVMKENLEDYKKGKVLYFFGGGALTKNFIDEYCRPFMMVQFLL